MDYSLCPRCEENNKLVRSQLKRRVKIKSAMFQLLAIVLAFLVYWRYSSRLPKAFPPGPRLPLPIVGDAYILKGKLAEGFRKLHDRYGDTFGLYLGAASTVVTKDFNLAKEILSRDEFSARPLFSSLRTYRGEPKTPGYLGVAGVALSSSTIWQVCVSN